MLCIVHRKGFIRNRIDKDAFSNTDTPVRPPVSITSLFIFFFLKLQISPTFIAIVRD